MASEEKIRYLPDLIELNLKSKTIDEFFLEVGNLISKSPKILNTNAALREFNNLQKFWVKKGNELIERQKEFFPNSIFSLCVNYCSFLDPSEPLMFLGRSPKGINLKIPKFPPSKIFCLVLFHSIESYQYLNQQDAKKQKINIYWNNFLKNQTFIDRFMTLEKVSDLPDIIEEIIGSVEKRKHPRFKTYAPVFCAMFGESVGKKQKEEARILNISLSGLLIEHLSPYHLNSILELEPILEENKLYLWGRVCRTNKYQTEGGMKFASGVNITNISEFDEDFLARYLSKLSQAT